MNTGGDIDGSAEMKDRGFVQRNRTEGHVIQCDGERAIIAALSGPSSTASDDYWTVGQLISIQSGGNRLVGLVHNVTVPDNVWTRGGDNIVHVHVEFLGEVRGEPDGAMSFSGGISRYPYPGAIAHRIRASDLSAVYAQMGQTSVPIGALTQDASVPAYVSVEDLISRHFAVVGTTGVGKSSAVMLLLRRIVLQRPDLRILILDPHNEFAGAFPDLAIAVDQTNIELPFWMLRLDEFADVIFRGRTPEPTEYDILRDLVQLAREKTNDSETGGRQTLRRKLSDRTVSVDTPIAYRLRDLLTLIEDRIGLLDSKAERPYLRNLKARLESIASDPRFRFMFAVTGGPETMRQAIARIFRIPHNGKPICTFQLAGLPSEVVNAVASVLCRLAFDIAMSSEGSLQTLVICEEAHRYIPADKDAGFWPTRQAIARIAKEGRKYGSYLGVISQRPGELDATILSQCNSIFAMRLGNERDQEIIKGALRGGARSMAGFLSSIANREAIAFGEAFSTPMRLTFETVPPHQLPGRRKAESLTSSRQVDDKIALDRIVDRLRSFENNAQTGAPEKPSDDSDLLGKPATIGRLETVTTTPLAPERPAPVVSHNSETAQSMKKLGDLVRNFRKDFEG
ncbi:ATP-binding protein [Ochrobactrum sp. Q0168]|uniref:ATP-binding protein n=1 Tax=Ochrobactrum sp. Q0168 TaxID=2793241 RepID=UPI001FFE3002